MKQRILRLTPEELIRVLQGKTIQFNWPADMELIDIKYDAFARQVTAVIRSDFFEDTVEGSPTPEFVYESSPQQQSPTPAPVTIVKTDSKAPINVSTAPAFQKSLIQTLTTPSQSVFSATNIGQGLKR